MQQQQQQQGGAFRPAVPIDIGADPAFDLLDGAVAFGDLLEYCRFTRTKASIDMDEFLVDFAALLEREMKRLIGNRRSVRVGVCVHVTYEKVNRPDAVPVQGYLRNQLMSIIGLPTIPQVIHSTLETIRMRHANFMRETSGLRLVEVRTADIYASKFNPLSHVGRSFVELPPFLALKKAIVNVQNTDNRCFAYAILSALHPAMTHSNRVTSYDRFFQQHPKLSRIEYPVEIVQLESVERETEIAVNVFSFFDDEGRGRYPMYLSKISQDNAVDLLFWNGHFAWIKNFSRFLGDTTKNGHARLYCKRCLGHFFTEQVLRNHQLFCQSLDSCKQIYTMPDEGTKLSFYNVRFQQRFPFVIYADFEALTVPCNESVTAKAHAGIPKSTYQTHKPISVGLKLVSSQPGVLDKLPYETYTGDDVVEWFLRRLLEYRTLCLEYLFDERRLVMTDADRKDFENASACYICQKPFPVVNNGVTTIKKSMSKVRDHDHISGAYRGPAHSKCNLRLRTTYKLPIFLHNFRNYDGHLIVPAFTCFKETKLSVIGQGLEKYMTLTWDDTLVFKDSLQFLSGSLESLVDCLRKSGKDAFVHLRENLLLTTDEEGVDLLIRKGVYPYDHMSDKSRLEEDRLPSREAFFNRLAGRECSKADYEHAQRVWQKFDCKTMQDYHDLYLKTDVFLLVDVFESFRSATLKNFGLDPSYYVSSPQLSWDCMMKMTECELTLLTDPAMFEIINRNLRGGISVITKRHAKANNKYMGDAFDPTDRSSYIMYLDANNLYGWAMSEPLPYDDFQWLSAHECEEIDWRQQLDDQEYGYFVECDFDYPRELHDAHNDYPLAPERLTVEDRLLSTAQLGLREKYTISHSATAKLIPNFFEKTQQLVHYRNLRYYLEHGLLLTKVHKAIRFKQSRWLQPYIQINTDLRAKSKDPVEVKLRKDMNNSIYGKTCENLTKRSDIRLVNSRKVCEKLINKPQCRRFQVFTGDLAAIELQKVKCLINKPTYVGFAVLELSKLHMYKFHYDKMRTWYPDAELLFTDTDSLVYQVFTDDLYAELASRRDAFDFSNYDSEHQLFGEENKMALGKMKDESSGAIITEFVGLRPKMYSYTTIVADKLKESKRAKGIQRAAAASITHADYLAQLRIPAENYVNIRRIGQRHHRVYTLEGMKRGLCAFDDKRFLQPDGVHTLAHGHYRLRKRQITESEHYQYMIMEDDIPRSTVVRDEHGEAIESFIPLTSAQATAMNIRTSTRAEALDAIAGADLRQSMRRVVDHRPVTSTPGSSKRARIAAVRDDEEDEVLPDDDDLRMIDEVAQFVSLNDAF